MKNKQNELIFLFVCLFMHSNPTNDQIFQILDEQIDLNELLYGQQLRKANAAGRTLEPLRLSQMIASCHNNESIYRVMRLNNHIDIASITDYPKRFEIDQKLNDLIVGIEVQSNVELLSADATEGIEKLTNSKLNDFMAYKFLDNVWTYGFVQQFIYNDFVSYSLTIPLLCII